jgi:tRNA G18 (ribose-2'-O)-methylase SpoU
MTTERVPYRATAAAIHYEKLSPMPVRVLLDNVRSLYNVGSVFRTADGAGVERLILSGITGHPPSRGISKTALGAEESVIWEYTADPRRLVEALRERGYEIAAVETSLHSVDLHDWSPGFPVCVVFGHEVEGIRPELLEKADTYVRIPMLGLKHSLNVATAAGVVLYELLRKYRRIAEATAGEGNSRRITGG